MPMYYQTSLGTWDFISGLSLINKHWLIATGIQLPLNENRNNFDWHRWDQNNPNPDPNEIAYVKEYPNATHLRRGTDVMLRVERNFRFSRLNFSVGLLPIYRITPDIYTILNGSRISRKTVNGIEVGDKAVGLALSWITTMGYNFNVRSGVKLLVGHKIMQREFSPDGLTRELVTSFTYIYRF